MAKTTNTITPEDRLESWKKLWATPRRLGDSEAEAAFDEFVAGFVPSHMHKKFLQFFGVPKSQFGNRFFMEDAAFYDWKTKIESFGGGLEPHVEVTVIYGSPDRLEAHWLKGQSRRTLRDIVIDDWQAACAIVRTGTTILYVFIEPKMRGCIVRSLSDPSSPS